MIMLGPFGGTIGRHAIRTEVIAGLDNRHPQIAQAAPQSISDRERRADHKRHACSGAVHEFSWVRVGGVSATRSEEHTSELQSIMRISYAVFCLKKNTEY